jgi:hypothetical protein
MTKQIMIDIETLGTSSNCVVASIGAKVMFQEDGEEFYKKLDWSQQSKRGRVIEPSTVRWWLQQNADAQAEMVEVGEDVTTTLEALADFCGRDGHCFLWANGSVFDIGILRSLFADFGVGFPTTYDKELDFRTLRRVLEMVQPSYDIKWAKGETAHSALGDAKSQAHALENIFADIFKATPKAKVKAKPAKKTTPKKKAEPKPEPVEEVAETAEYTIEDVRAALKDYAAANGKDAAMSILSDAGAEKVSEIPGDMYQEIITKCGGNNG